MRAKTILTRLSSGLFLMMLTLASCSDEKVVFVERELFDEPLPEAGEFLGYSDHVDKLVVCGNCHVEKQKDWRRTAHANAWEELASNGARDGTCDGCHTVGEMGNTVEEVGGYDATGEARYEDVQCESCHGPGLTHVTNPVDENVPLAVLDVGVDRTSGCGECHSGPEQPFVEEWAASRHGDGAHVPQYRTRDGCMPCHSGKGALETWGFNTNYLEVDDPGAAIGVTCAVCHDPHSAENNHQLRYPIEARDVDGQICMRCHQRRAVPTPDGRRGPHSPQGPLLLGEIGTVGWTPPNFAYDVDRIAGTHGSEANLELCATCHMRSFTVTDASGKVIWDATGHLFDPIPCMDDRGVPLADDSCPKTLEDRSFAACTASGCHGSEESALSAYLVAQDRIGSLVEELNALLALVPESEFDPDDDIFTVAEGARFNARLGEITSSAIHNPFLTEALLTASIEIMKEEYGLATQSNVVTRDIMWELSRGGR